MEQIRVIITGGTFDKEYNEITGKLFFRNSHVLEILALGRCKLKVQVETLMMIDSLDMTLEDRESILQHCLDCSEDKIIITHGTDTMVETARHLGSRLGTAQATKTVVLTGAMIPFKFGSSDGLFNMGSALAFVQALPCGVYIAMNGLHFVWNNVRKNQQLGSFEANHSSGS